MTLFEKLREALPKTVDLEENVSFHELTSFKTGGACAVLIRPTTVEAVGQTLYVLKKEEIPFVLLGRGSNVLAPDEDYPGAVLYLDAMDGIEVNENRITAEAGVSLARLAQRAALEGLGGFEFASGIPGSVGGAIYMNAGAYGGEMADVVRHVTAMDYEGHLYKFNLAECGFGYRKSFFQNGEYIILSVEIELCPAPSDDIFGRMRELNQRRREKQPLEYPSAGSTFKRPEGNYAGALIEQAGLKGKSIGGACVSEKHAGFIINTGEATSADIIALVAYVRDTVEAMSGIRLEPEIKKLGKTGFEPWD